MSQAQVCSNCGSSEIDIDQSRGDAVCTNCGSVLEDNFIVSEVTFAENSVGGTSVIGQFVSAEGNKSGLGLGSGFRHGLGRESRQITLDNGRKRIQSVGNQLQLNSHCVDTAYNFFKLAVNKRLTRGRKTNLVVAACLYLVCRTERTPHLLLDFSDVLQTDVFLLGRAYLRLAHELCINVPAIDPCLYIPRFTHKLDFGDKEHEVSMTALRLVCRMKRDWIHHGRRPSGLCGAAVLVSARLHGFNRTIKEVVKVVRMSSTTIRKRLYEFGNTPSGQLTLDEFQNIDLEEEQDPPSFTMGRKKAKQQQQQQEVINPDVAEEVEELQKHIDKIIEDAMKQKEAQARCYESAKKKSDNNENNTELNNSSTSTELAPQGLLGSTAPPNEGAQGSETSASVTNVLQSINPSGIQSILETLPAEDKDQNQNDDCEVLEEDLDLTGLDDDELDTFLLDDNEVQVKTKVWMEENKEFLEKQKEKEEREAKEREKEGNKEKKKYKKHKKKNQEPATTAGEAIEKMLVEKKISSKINYDVLRDLNKEPVKQPEPPPTLPDLEVTFLRPAVLPRKTRTMDSLSISPSSALAKRRKLSHTEPSTRKSMNEVSQLPGLPVVPAPAAQSSAPEKIVVESGPVEYVHEEGVVEEEDEEEEYDENISTAQLLMQGYGDDDDYGEYEDDF